MIERYNPLAAHHVIRSGDTPDGRPIWKPAADLSMADWMSVLEYFTIHGYQQNADGGWSMPPNQSTERR